MQSFFFRHLFFFFENDFYLATIDRVPPEKPQGTGIHWQVAQSTSLINIVVEMSTATNTSHQGMYIFFGYAWSCFSPWFVGIWMENGRWVLVPNFLVELTKYSFDSGGFMGDLVFNGGTRVSKPLTLFLHIGFSKGNMAFGVEINSKSYAG